MGFFYFFADEPVACPSLCVGLAVGLGVGIPVVVASLAVIYILHKKGR